MLLKIIFDFSLFNIFNKLYINNYIFTEKIIDYKKVKIYWFRTVETIYFTLTPVINHENSTII